MKHTPFLPRKKAVLTAAVPERDYADWYEEGEAFVRANSPARNDAGIRELVHGWMQIHCPAKLLAEHRAAVKAVRDATYGAAPFKLTIYGCEPVPAAALTPRPIGEGK